MPWPLLGSNPDFIPNYTYETVKIGFIILANVISKARLQPLCVHDNHRNTCLVLIIIPHFAIFM